MKATVVYESMYGNTRAVAEAIADGLGGAGLTPVREAADGVGGAELLVIGGPTHVHGLSSDRSRRAAVDAAEDPARVEPDAAEATGLRAWLDNLPEGGGAPVAVFDTRIDKSPWITGAASRGIAKRLRRHGYDVVATRSFLVSASEGPLVDGELVSAREWGAQLAASSRRASVQTSS